jgi:hypothetical protein
MTVTGENQSTLRKTRPTATPSTTNLTWFGVGSNSGVFGERPATIHLKICCGRIGPSKKSYSPVLTRGFTTNNKKFNTHFTFEKLHEHIRIIQKKSMWVYYTIKVSKQTC